MAMVRMAGGPMAKLKARWKNPEADQIPRMAPNLGIANAAMAATRGPATAAATQSPFLHDMTVRASIADPSQVAVTNATKRGRTCTGCMRCRFGHRPKGTT